MVKVLLWFRVSSQVLYQLNDLSHHQHALLASATSLNLLSELI